MIHLQMSLVTFHQRFMTPGLFATSAGAFNAFDKDGDGIIKLNVLEVIQHLRVVNTDITGFRW